MKKSRHNRKFWRSPTHSMLRLMPSGSVTWPVPGIVDLAKAQRNVNTLLATVEHLVSFAMRLQPRIFRLQSGRLLPKMRLQSADFADFAFRHLR